MNPRAWFILGESLTVLQNLDRDVQLHIAPYCSPPQRRATCQESQSFKARSILIIMSAQPSTLYDETPKSSSLVGQSADSCKPIHAFWLRLKTMCGGSEADHGEL